MRVAVVGSGPTGIAAAHQLHQRGIDVVVFDPGERHEDPEFVQALAALVRTGRRPGHQARRRLLGLDRAGALPTLLRDSAAVIGGEVPPETVAKRILGSSYVFRGIDHTLPTTGAWLPRSNATGGLANAWGAACYRLRADDWSDWPIGADELHPWYARAESLLGVSGDDDGLSRAYPAPDPLISVAGDTARDPVSPFEDLLPRWGRHRDDLAARGVAMGRSRLAVRPPGSDEDSCVRCGLCALGCPTGAIWSPRPTLQALVAAGVEHRPGYVVRRLVDGENDVQIIAESREVGRFDAAVLAAGTLGSFAIAAHGDDGQARISENDVAILPFLFRKPRVPRRARFTLSEAVIAIDPGVVADGPVHVQLYRASPGLLGPLGRLTGLGPSVLGRAVARGMGTAALGLVYLHGRDSRRIRVSAAGHGLDVRADGDGNAIAVAGRVAKLLASEARATGLVPLPALARATPPGTSVHLCGTLPPGSGPLSTDPVGRLHTSTGTGRVVVADHAAIPEAPAQNLTLTGVANALRVADALADRILGA